MVRVAEEFAPVDRVGWEVAGVDGEGEHAVEHLACLAYPGGPETGCLQVRHPLLDGHPVDMSQLVPGECGDDMSLEVRSVAGQGFGFEVRPGSEPPFGPLVDRDLR